MKSSSSKSSKGGQKAVTWKGKGNSQKGSQKSVSWKGK